MTSKGISLICVTTDYVEPDLNWEIEKYESLGITCRMNQMRGAAPEDIISVASDAHVLIVDQARISGDVIRGLPDCRLIIRHGDGYDNLDLVAATENGIVCANEPGFWSREVAEQTFATALSLIIKLPVQVSVARRGSESGWNYAEAMPYSGLGSRTVGVIGCGKIGINTIKLFAPVVDRVLAYDPMVDDSVIESAGGTAVTLEELVRDSDVLCLHLPASADTAGLFDADMIRRMKPGAILINASRGSIVDTDALVDALKKGRLSGAGLDATDPEPLPGNHPLFTIPNVIITPHMSWYSEDALWRLRRQIVEDVRAAGEERLPLSVVNPEVLTRNNLRFYGSRTS